MKFFGCVPVLILRLLYEKWSFDGKSPEERSAKGCDEYALQHTGLAESSRTKLYTYMCVRMFVYKNMYIYACTHKGDTDFCLKRRSQADGKYLEWHNFKSKYIYIHIIYM